MPWLSGSLFDRGVPVPPYPYPYQYPYPSPCPCPRSCPSIPCPGPATLCSSVPFRSVPFVLSRAAYPIAALVSALVWPCLVPALSPSVSPFFSSSSSSSSSAPCLACFTHPFCASLSASPFLVLHALLWESPKRERERERVDRPCSVRSNPARAWTPYADVPTKKQDLLDVIFYTCRLSHRESDVHCCRAVTRYLGLRYANIFVVFFDYLWVENCGM